MKNIFTTRIWAAHGQVFNGFIQLSHCTINLPKKPRKVELNPGYSVLANVKKL